MIRDEFILVSDLHIDEYSRFAEYSDGMNSRLYWSLDILTQIAEYGEEHGVKTLLIGGDVFHRRGIIPVAAYDAAYYLFSSLKSLGWEIICIVGNHDQESKSGSVNCLRPMPFRGNGDYGACTLENGTVVGTVSFSETPGEFLRRLELVKKMNPDCYLIHQGVNGAKIAGDEILSRHETNLEDIRHIVGESAYIFSGHYHVHQYVDPKFLYIGSATPMDFSDTTPKGFLHLIPGKNGAPSIKQIESRAPKFITINSDQLDSTETKGNYVRVLYSGEEPRDLDKLEAIGWIATKEKIDREYHSRSSIQPDQSPMVIFRKYLEEVTQGKNLEKDLLLTTLEKISGGRNFEQSLGGHKIDILEMEIKNFMRFREQRIDFQEFKGLTLVEGENADDPSATSNGAGKSTMLEAVKWCIFGSTARGLSGDEVINSTVGKNCSVEMIVLLDDETLCRIRRYRKDSTYKNQLFLEIASGENWEDLRGKSDSETQEKLISVLGMDEQTFDTTVFFGHGFTKSFAALSDREQKAILERILGVEYFSVLLEQARSRSKATEESIRSKEIKHSYLKSRLEEERNNRISLKRDHDAFEKERDLKTNSLKDKITQAKDFIETVKDSKEESSKIKSIEKDIESLSKSDDPESESLSKIKERINYSEQKCKTLYSERKSLEEKMSELVSIIDSSEKEYKIHSRELDNFSDSSVCPTCLQEIKSDRSSIEKKKSGYVLAMSSCESRKEVAAQEIGKLEPYILSNEEEINKYERVSRKAREKLENYSESLEKIRELEARKSTILKSRQQIESNLSSRKKEIERLESELKSNKNAENPLIPALERSSELIEQTEKEMEEQSREIESERLTLDLFKFWEVAFSDKGQPSQPPIKSYLFDSIVPVLDELARKYSEVLTSGSIEVRFNTVTALKSGELRDKFSVDVINKHGAEGYTGDSGGERRKVDLAVMFALHSLARIRSGSIINILCLDEILDSLDSEGCSRVMQLLRDMSNNIPIIFVITHNENLKMLFSSRILIRKKDGVSEIFDYASSEK